MFFCPTGHSPLGNSAIPHLWGILITVFKACSNVMMCAKIENRFYHILAIRIFHIVPFLKLVFFHNFIKKFETIFLFLFTVIGLTLSAFFFLFKNSTTAFFGLYSALLNAILSEEHPRLTRFLVCLLCRVWVTTLS